VMLIKILGQAAGGMVASQDVLALIGLQALNYLPILLILTGFISVLLVVTRSYQDSEMVVWSASGLSLVHWIGPVLRLGLPLLAMTTVLSFVLTPWANRQSDEFKERFEKREDIARISPGKFQESGSADRIFFVEALSGDSARVKNVFVNTFQNGRTSIVVAKEGQVEIDSRGDKFVVLDKGRRYDGIASQPDFRIMEFERYGVLVAQQVSKLMGDSSARSLATAALLRDRSGYNMGELLWRLAMPLMGLSLMLLAIPLGFVNPRAGRSANLLIALLLFVTYSNMVSVLQAAVAQQRLSFALAWWPLHLAALLVVAGLFWWRVAVNSRFHPLRLWSAVKRRQGIGRSA